jgi:hypothetical protein
MGVGKKKPDVKCTCMLYSAVQHWQHGSANGVLFDLADEGIKTSIISCCAYLEQVL